MLNLEFEKAIDDILKVIPAERKTYLFSATMTKKVSIHFQVDFCIKLQGQGSIRLALVTPNLQFLCHRLNENTSSLIIWDKFGPAFWDQFM